MSSDPRSIEELQAEVSSLRKRVAELEAESQELAQVRASEQELRELFSANTDVILVIDREGRYLKAAPTAPELLYRPSKEFLGKTQHEILPKDLADEGMAKLVGVLDSGEVATMEYSLDMRGHERWYLATISPRSKDTVLFVARDITDYKKIQVELQLKQEEIIRVQKAALAELTTPLIPIHDQIVIMPLIGTVDPKRAAQIMETLLHGIASRGAHVAILDITGVRMIDTHVANALVRAARAAELLGAQVVLTGIRPEVAATLVELGVDLGGIVTHGTLQSGVAFALSRRGATAAQSFSPAALR